MPKRIEGAITKGGTKKEVKALADHELDFGPLKLLHIVNTYLVRLRQISPSLE